MGRKPQPLPALPLLNELFSCNAQEGTLTRLTSRQGSLPPGTVIRGTKRYYKRVYLQGRSYLLSRVIWFMATGQEPGHMQVDHIDGDISNNAITNLRLVTPGQNNINKEGYAASGYKGVYIRKTASGKHRYYVQVHRTSGRNADGTYRRKTTTHGVYDCPAEASEAYKRAIKQFYSDGMCYARENEWRSEALAQLAEYCEVTRALRSTTQQDACAALADLTKEERLDIEVQLLALGIQVTDSSRGALADALWQCADRYDMDEACLDDMDDHMDGDHASALESAGYGDEPIGYESGDWL